MMALPFELVVAKPLVESHRVQELLNSFEHAKAIWMLRHYLPVAKSNLRKFGKDNGFRDLGILVDGGATNWRGEVSQNIRDRVATLLESGLSPLDAAAVFWWARNRLYLDQDLRSEDRVKVMSYEALMKRPEESLMGLSKFVGLPLPMSAMQRSIRTAPNVSGVLRPDVESMCSQLLEELRTAPSILD